jgi:hypothetical protein
MGIAVQRDRAEVGDAGLDPGVEGEGKLPARLSLLCCRKNRTGLHADPAGLVRDR